MTYVFRILITIIPLMSVVLFMVQGALSSVNPTESNNLLKDIPIYDSIPTVKYQRKEYGYGLDADKDGKNTRTEHLINNSLNKVSFKTAKERRVDKGKWFDPYTGVTFHSADAVDIDHLVALYEVHISGGYKWSAEKKRAYANDLGADSPLRITHRWTNRIPKSADDPTEYTPSYVPGRCQYLKDWINIKRKWGLSMDSDEAEAISDQMKACA